MLSPVDGKLEAIGKSQGRRKIGEARIRCRGRPDGERLRSRHVVQEFKGQEPSNESDAQGKDT